MAGSFGYELDLNCLSDEEKKEVAEQVKKYKGYQKLIYDGKYYRLSNPYEDGMSAWSWISEDRKQVLVQGVVFRAVPNSLRRRLRLSGLDADARYQDVESGAVYTGAALMSGGLLLPWMSGDDAAFEVCLMMADNTSLS